MFDLFRRKPPSGNTHTNEIVRPWLTMERSTVSLIRDFAKMGGLQMFAGAVFALQQDTLQAYGIDMRKTDDAFSAAALDRALPHKLGEFPERYELTLRAMQDIDNLNLDYIAGEKPIGLTEEQHRINLLGARIRSEASRIWLLTMMSKIDQYSTLRLGAVTIWTALQTVLPDELFEDAKSFTGTYFNGIRSNPLNLNHWPQRLDFLGDGADLTR